MKETDFNHVSSIKLAALVLYAAAIANFKEQRGEFEAADVHVNLSACEG